MKTNVLFVFAVLAALPATFAASPTLEIGVASVEVSGVRPYAAQQNLSINETDHVTVPTLRLGYPVTPDFSLGLSYCRYADLKSSGLAGSADIFNRGGVSAAVVTPVRGSEDIREFALDGRYCLAVTKKLGLEFGLVLSQFQSKVEIGTAYAVVRPTDNSTFIDYRKQGEFKADDFRLGATVAVRFALARAWNLIASYRYAAPPERKLQLYGLALEYRI